MGKKPRVRMMMHMPRTDQLGSLRITDKSSGVVILELEFNCDEFCDIMTNLERGEGLPCEFGRFDLVGCTLQQHTYTWDAPEMPYGHNDEEPRLSALKAEGEKLEAIVRKDHPDAVEVSVRTSDMVNFHRRVEGGYEVSVTTFHRPEEKY